MIENNHKDISNIDVISECIKLLERDGHNTKKIVHQMLIDYREVLMNKNGYWYHKECKDKKCDVIDQLKTLNEQLMCQGYFCDYTEEELKDYLCRYVYENGTPATQIHYDFFNGLQIVEPKYIPKTICEFDGTSISCKVNPEYIENYGEDEMDDDWL